MSRSSSAASPKRPYARLAEFLLGLRREACLTQRKLADTAKISRGAVQRAESGTAAPSRTILNAYIRACGGTSQEQARATALRNQGRTVARDRLGSLNAPAPAYIRTRDDLAAALAVLYERAGAPPLRELSRLAPDRPPLPATTAWRIVHRKSLPTTTQQLTTFLHACQIRPADALFYLEAYTRLTDGLRVRPRLPRHKGGRLWMLDYRPDDRFELTGQAAAIARHLPPQGIEDLLFNAVTRAAVRGTLHGEGPAPDL
ncbi:helix-turn-helix domain-containing protein [Streptomyces sp. NPDC059002]|uniref:helix-turn-helix domain-containing protein n=1 Tax=Streptomyces sp. NPDC059002 TaxID=3346690 RepID=UPI0036801406